MRMRNGLVLLAGLAIGLSGCGGSAGHVRLSVRPESAPVDSPVTIRLTGLRAGARVTVAATAKDVSGKTWRSSATFVADKRGGVDVTRDPSVAGTYKGRDAMGLFWSMHEVGSSIPVDQQFMRPPRVLRVTLDAAVGGRTVASTTLRRQLVSGAVQFQQETLASQGFIGCYWSPKHPQRAEPAILMFGGSEGGVDCGYGLLAAHGYPELHVAYFGLAGLPKYLGGIQLAYFAHALRWLAQQPGVDPSRLVISGASRGAEAAILTAAAYPSLVHAAVEYVGAAFTGSSNGPGSSAAWTVRGKPIPVGTPLPVWKVDGPVLLIGGIGDTLTASGYAVQSMASELRTHHRHDFVALAYENAGHALASGWPYVPAGTNFGTGPLGGTLAGDAHAREDSWRKLLAFLGRLKPGGS